jgi:glycopeptide antibiotics resistance protein
MGQVDAARIWISRVGGTATSAATAAARAARRRRWGTLAGRVFATLVLAVCGAVLLKLTLTPSPGSVDIAHTNLKPGATIRLYLRYASRHEQLVELGGNVLIGVPFGLLLPTVSPRLRGLLRVLFVTGVVITLIELAQHFFVLGRSFDVDDVILAGAGAVIGYVSLGRYLALRLHPEHRHWWQRRLDSMTARSRKRRSA